MLSRHLKLIFAEFNSSSPKPAPHTGFSVNIKVNPVLPDVETKCYRIVFDSSL